MAFFSFFFKSFQVFKFNNHSYLVTSIGQSPISCPSRRCFGFPEQFRFWISSDYSLTLLALIARSSTLILSVARSLTHSRAHGKEGFDQFRIVSTHCAGTHSARIDVSTPRAEFFFARQERATSATSRLHLTPPPERLLPAPAQTQTPKPATPINIFTQTTTTTTTTKTTNETTTSGNAKFATTQTRRQRRQPLLPLLHLLVLPNSFA